MTAAAEKVIVLSDSSKIGKRSFSKIGDISDVNILITDDAISNKHKKELEDLGIKVVIA
jgi:DeoR family transcriptional regulator of aga operon